jgi:glycosyltransferase involved in cell wall biosynthesis
MRVALDVRPAQYPRDGVGVYVLHLVDALLTRFPEVEFDLLAASSLAAPDLRELPNNAHLHAIAPGYHEHFRRDLWEQVQLPRMLAAIGADVYHSTNYILPIRRPRACGLVVTLHDAYAFVPSPSYNSLSARRVRALVRASVRRADQIVFDSEFTRGEFTKKLGPRAAAKGRSIHLGPPPLASYKVDTGLLQEVPAVIRSKRPYALAVGSIHPRKNYARLIEAFASPALGALDLVIVGSPGAVPNLAERARKLGLLDRVHLLGFLPTPALIAIIRGARLMVTPSLYEGFALPLLEALQLGVPVCASDIGCFREIAGEAAAYFDPFSVKDMAICIQRLANDSSIRRTLEEKAQQVLTRYSWGQCADQHMDVYVEAMNTRFPEKLRDYPSTGRTGA